jgi:hypothetical protein
MKNPFELILERLNRIEKAIQNLSVNGADAHQLPNESFHVVYYLTT